MIKKNLNVSIATVVADLPYNQIYNGVSAIAQLGENISLPLTRFIFCIKLQKGF